MKKHVGSVGIDIRKLRGVDVVADVRKLPLKDDNLEEVFLSHILEHIHDLVSFMKEVWRVCKESQQLFMFERHISPLTEATDPLHAPPF